MYFILFLHFISLFYFVILFHYTLMLWVIILLCPDVMGSLFVDDKVKASVKVKMNSV